MTGRALDDFIKLAAKKEGKNYCLASGKSKNLNVKSMRRNKMEPHTAIVTVTPVVYITLTGG